MTDVMSFDVSPKRRHLLRNLVSSSHHLLHFYGWLIVHMQCSCVAVAVSACQGRVYKAFRCLVMGREGGEMRPCRQ